MNRHYRVIRMESSTGDATYVMYQICYDDQGTIRLVSTDPASPSRKTLSELRDDLEQMRLALEQPVLEEEDVLNAVESSNATAYGAWLREQVLDPPHPDVPPPEVTVSHAGTSQIQQRTLEKMAELFAEKVRNDPSFGL